MVFIGIFLYRVRFSLIVGNRVWDLEEKIFFYCLEMSIGYLEDLVGGLWLYFYFMFIKYFFFLFV